MLFTPAEMERIEHIHREILYLRAKVRLLDLELALKAGFNPNQPRVPQGNPDGGQWTRVGGGSPSNDRTQQPPAARDNAGTQQSPAVRDSAGNAQQLVRDETGEESWSAHLDTRRTDGSLAEQHILNRDGSRIHSEFAAPDAGVEWNERHTVTAADGRTIVIENSGQTQSVRGGDGQLLTRTTWTNAGPEPEAIVQPAFAPAIPFIAPLVTTTVELGLVLFTWLSTRTAPGKKPVISFKARDFVKPEDGGFELEFVGLLSREEVKDVCRQYDVVQKETNQAAKEAGPKVSYSSPATYGTSVHHNLKLRIDGLGEFDLKAELSLIKALEEAQGTPGAIRIDVFEDAGQGTICVYDIKTGLRGLSKPRSLEIAAAVYRNYDGTQRIIVIEVRPKK